MSDATRLLDAVIQRGSAGDLAAWAASGRNGLLVLRSELTRSELGRWEGVHPKDAIDSLGEATAAIAAKHPDAFLEVFADSTFDDNGFVLRGLAAIDDRRATERLLIAARSEDSWRRLDGAIGLGGRNDPAAVDALLRLIDDPEYLVRYHALRGLAAARNPRAVGTLRAWNPHSDLERQMAEYAIAFIDGSVLPTGPRIEAAMSGLRSRDVGAR